MKNSSPGPDGITYADLRGADPGAEVLTAAYNACRRVESIPSLWKESNTILLHKKGERDDLSNWRPIAMGDVIPKLFAAVMADRLTRWAVQNRRLSPAQKGFLPYEGCLEHNFVLQGALADAKRRRREMVVAWLDLSNAFGSVPHATILGALAGAGAPRATVNLVRCLYTDCTTRVRTAEGFTDRIPMRSGVRQGCPLSPILFNLAIEPVVRQATESGAGYEMAGFRVAALAYADDIALIATSPESMRGLLGAAEATARGLGLAFNPGKCATLHVLGSGAVARTEFGLNEGLVPALGDGDAYEHLGVPTGVRIDQTPYSAIRDVLRDLGAVDRSLLAPWQKVETLRSVIIPRLDFLLRGASLRKSALAEVDKAVRRAVKGWLNLPQRASAEVVYIPPSRGGCGILPLADLADVTTVAHAFRLLNAGDPVVASVARASLDTAARDKLRRPPTEGDLAEYLSGRLTGDFALPTTGCSSFWSRVRSAALRSAARFGFQWRWDDGRAELSVEIASRGEPVVVSPGAKAEIIRRMRAAVTGHYMETLVRKPDQGKVFGVTSRHAVSNHFMRGGSFTRFADWRFIHRARLDVLPLNGAIRWGGGDKRCRRCGYKLESLPHVLGHCGVHSAARQLRHHGLVRRLATATRLPGDIRVDRRVPGAPDELAALRPDIVVTHEPSRTVHLVDVAVPFENTSVAFEEAKAEKLRKYAPLACALRRRGYTVHVDAFIVGALGAWCPENEALLKTLRVSWFYARIMRRLMVSETIAWSRDMYVEHVSGIRQYPAPTSAPDANNNAAAPRRLSMAEGSGCVARGNEVIVQFPFPEVFNCPHCHRGATALQRGAAVYRRHEDLGKHLRLHHSGITRRFVCGECGFTDSSAYALRKVKLHHAANHSSGALGPPAAGAPSAAPGDASASPASGPAGGTGSPREGARSEAPNPAEAGRPTDYVLRLHYDNGEDIDEAGDNGGDGSGDEGRYNDDEELPDRRRQAQRDAARAHDGCTEGVQQEGDSHHHLRGGHPGAAGRHHRGGNDSYGEG
ncbi:uncharacterized protein LOC122404008 [Colletes gigas]|uniref:uncharacterized protein LOC122404008 n=1 Tax=Colletes gigas TaxID=935657 RepID=UPI001C9ACBA2|nr:uncharacterized protein LOC122404008 [Colletes gigas]